VLAAPVFWAAHCDVGAQDFDRTRSGVDYSEIFLARAMHDHPLKRRPSSPGERFICLHTASIPKAKTSSTKDADTWRSHNMVFSSAESLFLRLVS
jgi:hypothetical protein